MFKTLKNPKSSVSGSSLIEYLKKRRSNGVRGYSVWNNSKKRSGDRKKDVGRYSTEKLKEKVMPTLNRVLNTNDQNLQKKNNSWDQNTNLNKNNYSNQDNNTMYNPDQSKNTRKVPIQQLKEDAPYSSKDKDKNQSQAQNKQQTVLYSNREPFSDYVTPSPFSWSSFWSPIANSFVKHSAFHDHIGAPIIPKGKIVDEGLNIKLTAEFPGLKMKDIYVNIDEKSRMLIIKGAPKKEEKKYGEKIVEKNEYYEQQYSVPKDVELQNISATFKDGNLEINMPKANNSNQEMSTDYSMKNASDYKNEYTDLDKQAKKDKYYENSNGYSEERDYEAEGRMFAEGPARTDTEKKMKLDKYYEEHPSARSSGMKDKNKYSNSEFRRNFGTTKTSEKKIYDDYEKAKESEQLLKPNETTKKAENKIYGDFEASKESEKLLKPNQSGSDRLFSSQEKNQPKVVKASSTPPNTPIDTEQESHPGWEKKNKIEQKEAEGIYTYQDINESKLKEKAKEIKKVAKDKSSMNIKRGISTFKNFLFNNDKRNISTYDDKTSKNPYDKDFKNQSVDQKQKSTDKKSNEYKADKQDKDYYKKSDQKQTPLESKFESKTEKHDSDQFKKTDYKQNTADKKYESKSEKHDGDQFKKADYKQNTTDKKYDSKTEKHDDYRNMDQKHNTSDKKYNESKVEKHEDHYGKTDPKYSSADKKYNESKTQKHDGDYRSKEELGEHHVNVYDNKDWKVGKDEYTPNTQNKKSKDKLNETKRHYSMFINPYLINQKKLYTTLYRVSQIEEQRKEKIASDRAEKAFQMMNPKIYTLYKENKLPKYDYDKTDFDSLYDLRMHSPKEYMSYIESNETFSPTDLSLHRLKENLANWREQTHFLGNSKILSRMSDTINNNNYEQVYSPKKVLQNLSDKIEVMKNNSLINKTRKNKNYFFTRILWGENGVRHKMYEDSLKDYSKIEKVMDNRDASINYMDSRVDTNLGSKIDKKIESTNYDFSNKYKKNMDLSDKIYTSQPWKGEKVQDGKWEDSLGNKHSVNENEHEYSIGSIVEKIDESASKLKSKLDEKLNNGNLKQNINEKIEKTKEKYYEAKDKIKQKTDEFKENVDTSKEKVIKEGRDIVEDSKDKVVKEGKKVAKKLEKKLGKTEQ